MLFSASIVIIISLIYGFYPHLSKYPPTTLYLAYGIFCSIVLYELFTVFTIKRLKKCRVFNWMSTNSFNIYFAHVFILYIFDYGKILNDFWWAQYIILLFGAIMLTLVYLTTKKFLLNHAMKRLNTT